tara:strand:- start:178 stop:450 length:273 start_codon:yes stop_codon:yes gene_type:complete
MKRTLLCICLFVITLPVWAQNNIDPSWDEKSCSEIYKSIGIFVSLADKSWKKDVYNSEKTAAFYASVASDYATIYQTVCRKKNKNSKKSG